MGFNGCKRSKSRDVTTSEFWASLVKKQIELENEMKLLENIKDESSEQKEDVVARTQTASPAVVV